MVAAQSYSQQVGTSKKMFGSGPILLNLAGRNTNIILRKALLTVEKTREPSCVTWQHCGETNRIEQSFVELPESKWSYKEAERTKLYNYIAQVRIELVK